MCAVETNSPVLRPSPLLQAGFWITLVAVYSSSRFVAATRGIPLFIDEAIHVDWAHPSARTFLPLDPSFDGKWLSIKLFALATRLPGLNSVLAARLTVSVLGLLTAVAIYLIGRDLFSRTAGAISASLYVVLPFTVIYNSLALSDGVQLAFAAWAIFAVVRVTRQKRALGAAIALPLFLIAAILAKFSGVVLAVIPLMAVLLLMKPAQWPRGLIRIAPTLVLALSLIGWLYTNGLLQVFNTKTSGEALGRTSLIWQNLLLTGAWLAGLLTPVIAILSLGAFGWLFIRLRNRQTWFLGFLLCLNVLPYVVAARVWYPRYLLLALIPIVLAIGATLTDSIGLVAKDPRPRKATAILAVVVIGIFSWPIARSGFVLFDLPNANLPAIEQFQLVNGWPSGYGTPELVIFLREQSENTPGGVTVARTIFNDHPLHTLNIYLTPSATLSVLTLGDDNPAEVLALAQLSARMRVLFVLATENGSPERIRLPALPLLQCGRPIWSITRPKGSSGFVVYDLRCDENQIKALNVPRNQ